MHLLAQKMLLSVGVTFDNLHANLPPFNQKAFGTLCLERPAPARPPRIFEASTLKLGHALEIQLSPNP
jgi:hypothetical protein